MKYNEYNSLTSEHKNNPKRVNLPLKSLNLSINHLIQKKKKINDCLKSKKYFLHNIFFNCAQSFWSRVIYEKIRRNIGYH